MSPPPSYSTEGSPRTQEHFTRCPRPGSATKLLGLSFFICKMGQSVPTQHYCEGQMSYCVLCAQSRAGARKVVHTFAVNVTFLIFIRPSNKYSPSVCCGPEPMPGGGGPGEGKTEPSPALPAAPSNPATDLAGRETVKLEPKDEQQLEGLLVDWKVGREAER